MDPIAMVFGTILGIIAFEFDFLNSKSFNLDLENFNLIILFALLSCSVQLAFMSCGYFYVVAFVFKKWPERGLIKIIAFNFVLIFLTETLMLEFNLYFNFSNQARMIGYGVFLGQLSAIINCLQYVIASNRLGECPSLKILLRTTSLIQMKAILLFFWDIIVIGICNFTFLVFWFLFLCRTFSSGIFLIYKIWFKRNFENKKSLNFKFNTEKIIH